MARQNNKRQEADSPFSFGAAVDAPGKDEGAKRETSGAVFGSKEPVDAGPDYGYRKRRTHKHDEVSVYNEQMDERYAMDRRLKVVVALLVAAVVLVPLTMVLPTHVLDTGSAEEALAWAGTSLGGRIKAVSEIFSGTAAGSAMAIVLWQTLAVFLAGAALALNGAVYQGALKNALASPSTLGVMSGGTLGTVVYTLVFTFPQLEQGQDYILLSDAVARYAGMNVFEYIVATQMRALCSVAGCFLVVALVLLIAHIAGRGKVSKVGLLISGQVFSAVITSFVEMVRVYLRDNGTDAQYEAVRSIVGGGIDNVVTPLDVVLIAVPVAIGICIVMALRYRLNLLAFNDAEARSMGLSTTRTRNAVIVVCTILTAVIVSFCGSVGFVGFLVPHLVRKMVGPDFRYYIPASICMGAIYLLLAHYIMNLGGFLAGSLGTFTSLIGVVFFIVVAIRQRARGNVDWI